APDIYSLYLHDALPIYLLPVLKTSLQFTFVHPSDQKEWMGTLHPTEDFPNQAYLTLQSSEPLKEVLKRDAIGTILFVLAALLARSEEHTSELQSRENLV